MHQLVVVYVYVVFFNFADQLQDNDAVDIRRACFRAASKVLGLMGLLSNAIQREQLVPMDHIYTYRCSMGVPKLYAHHGIYFGLIYVGSPADGRCVHEAVMHFVRNHPGTDEKYSCDHCRGIWHRELGGVRISCLDCFLHGGYLYRYEYSVSFFTKMFKLAGTCSSRRCDSAAVVLRRALDVYYHTTGTPSFRTWRLWKNCESFAYYAKTGTKSVLGSKQFVRGTAGFAFFLAHL